MEFLYFLFLINLAQLVQSENVFDVTKYGADIKGVNKSTDAVRKAIDAATLVGGGTVYFPEGEYLCGPIHLKSNITLHLADNSIIKFSNDFDDYLPMIRMRWEGTILNNFSPLIYSYQQQNLAIRGKGILEGQGSNWWTFHNKLKEEYKKTKKRDTKYQKEFLHVNNLTEIANERMDMSSIDVAFLRPPFIQLFDSKNILIEGVTVRNSPFWNINPVLCQNLTIRGVKIEAPYPSPNTDGIDPDSCKDVFISDVEINVGDDCIAIKSGRDLQGRRIGRPTENLVISNCKMLKGISGVAIGSEQSGGVKNVTVKDCVFNGTDRGFYIKSTRGRGGVVENIHYKNVSMIDIKKHVIEISMRYTRFDPHKIEPFSDKTPVFRDITFEDIRGEAQSSVIMAGLPESLISNVELKNVTIISKVGLEESYTTNLKMSGYSQKTPE